MQSSVYAAREECERVRAAEDVTPDDITSLVSICKPVLSSPEAAEDFATTVGEICSYVAANRVAAAAAGAIEAVVSSLVAHGAISVGVAARGCETLGLLASNNAFNADVIVLSSGGLDAILSAMESNAGEYDVQKEACVALVSIAEAASAAAVGVLRGARVIDVINAAKVNHPQEGAGTVKYWAEHTLATLAE